LLSLVKWPSSLLDLFRPNIEAAIRDNKMKLDSETERYILNMLDSKEQNVHVVTGGANTVEPDFTAEQLPGGVHGARSMVAAVGVQDKEEQAYRELAAGVDHWEFDVFDVVWIPTEHTKHASPTTLLTLPSFPTLLTLLTLLTSLTFNRCG
jgi:hypothetical protein